MSLVVGQRYKFHWKKGYNTGDREGTNPNRYNFIGTYAGAETVTWPDGSTHIVHKFTDARVPVPEGTLVMETLRVGDERIANQVAVKMTGGSRRSSRRASRRRTTRRHR